MKLITILFCLTLLISGALAAETKLPPNRINWTQLQVFNPSSAGNAVGDGVSDDTMAIQGLINSTPTGTSAVIVPGTYKINGRIWVARPISIMMMDGVVLKFNTNSTDQGIRITSSNVTIQGGSIVGPQYAGSVSTQNAIDVFGTDSAHYLENIVIEDVAITKWYYGIRLKFVEEFVVKDCRVDWFYQAGIQTLSVSHGDIDGNYVADCHSPVGGGRYGIAISHLNNDILSDNPFSNNVTVRANKIERIIEWEGLDTHAGRDISFIDNQIRDCTIGIAVIPYHTLAGVNTIGAKRVIVSGNFVDSSGIGNIARGGIVFIGATNYDNATGIISNNVINTVSTDEGVSRTGGIYAYRTEGLVIAGNRISSCSPYGVFLNFDNYGFSMTGNAIIDIWSDVTSTNYGIFVSSSNNLGVISGNTLLKTGSLGITYAHYFERGIHVGTSSSINVICKANYIQGPDIAIYDPSDRLCRSDYVTMSTSGTGADTLQSISIPGGRLGAGTNVRVIAYGHGVGSAGAKTVTISVGTLSFAAIPSMASTADWKIELEMVSSGYNSQKISVVGMVGTSLVYQKSYIGAFDTSAGTDIECVGECTAAADTISQYAMMMDIS